MPNGAATFDPPVWAKIFVYLMGTIGFPVMVAAFLLAQTAGWLPSLDQKNTVAIESLNQQIADHRVRQEVLTETLKHGFRILCENGARSQQERNNCAQIR